ncbi:hypothetical protein JQ615_12130 [Bradyrhizobium jicamae]|uniref:Uncharacterized protein n=1 Tax=Bradyrhizobium jicamae TaxID=280332 RepID=A0ABS5FHB3_9BRAD|nr:hypothetical protein [Bradyrhizobium jicamae]MBR0796137.1 hypothetical protein [Bradyrhizobium jicamae]MBR0935736.1 hypothetical protein [Bradyrhizobium jicamae]
MSNALDHPDKLFARADAAIADSKRLAEEIIRQYDEVRAALRRRRLRAVFEPKPYRVLAPIDFPDRRTLYEPFPSENDDV